MLALKEGIGHAQKFVGARAWDGYVLGPLSNITTSSSDAELEAFIHANASPNGHIVATASMSPQGAQHGVVDPDLRVKGIERLRIVDASILVRRILMLNISNLMTFSRSFPPLIRNLRCILSVREPQT